MSGHVIPFAALCHKCCWPFSKSGRDAEKPWLCEDCDGTCRVTCPVREIDPGLEPDRDKWRTSK
jgi:hypothetical protein